MEAAATAAPAQLPQHMRALAHANQIRLARAALKRLPRPSRRQRLDLETVLRHQYRPPLNDQSLPPRTPAQPTLAEVLASAYPVESGGNAIASAYARHRGRVENALAVARRYPSPGNALARAGLGLLPRR